MCTHVLLYTLTQSEQASQQAVFVLKSNVATHIPEPQADPRRAESSR